MRVGEGGLMNLPIWRPSFTILVAGDHVEPPPKRIVRLFVCAGTCPRTDGADCELLRALAPTGHVCPVWADLVARRLERYTGGAVDLLQEGWTP